MNLSGFPTSSDIYLEVDGKKVAVVQSYSARTSKTSQTVEAFGEDEPVATIPDKALRHRRGHPGRHQLPRPGGFQPGHLQA